MKQKMKMTLLAALLGVVFTAELPAQSTAFTYQGSLSENGQPANGIYDFRFTIYDALSGGTTVGGPLDRDEAGVTNGLFTVTLDFGAAVFEGRDLWLEVAVRSGTSTGLHDALSPRHQLTSTPCAIQAASARTVDMGIIRNPTFLGTSNNAPLELFVNHQRALRLEDKGTSPNVIGGHGGNSTGGVDSGNGGIGLSEDAGLMMSSTRRRRCTRSGIVGHFPHEKSND